MSGRDVDQQLPDMAARHRLEMVDHGIDMPTFDEGRERLDDWPCLADELAEAAGRQLAINLCADVRFC